MEELPDAARIGQLLRTTALRGFEPDEDGNSGIPWGNDGRRITIAWSDCPIPSVLKLALTLIDLPAYGPGEKVAWWVPFAYGGHRYELAHQKFGLRLRFIDRGVDPSDVMDLLLTAQSKLLAAMRIVEKSISATSKEMVDAGDATVRNQHYQLQMTYEYFRERAVNPAVVEDEHTVVGEMGGPEGYSATFRSGSAVMELNATRDLAAAVTAYFSRLEHDLVLALPFAGFDTSSDHLTQFIGSRWGLKYERVLGKTGEAKAFLDRLVAVVERWRNPYAHGGFEKGHHSTVFIHVPGAGALPIGLSSIRAKPTFSLTRASEPAMREVFALFDEFDAWFETTQSHAHQWIASGLSVRFDVDFCSIVRSLDGDGTEFASFLAYMEYRQDTIDNMDF